MVIADFNFFHRGRGGGAALTGYRSITALVLRLINGFDTYVRFLFSDLPCFCGCHHTFFFDVRRGLCIGEVEKSWQFRSQFVAGGARSRHVFNSMHQLLCVFACQIQGQGRHVLCRSVELTRRLTGPTSRYRLLFFFLQYEQMQIANVL